MSCADCVSRRQFLASAAAAAALSACGDGQVSGIREIIPDIGAPGTPGTPSSAVTVIVSTLPGLATTGNLVQLPGTSIAAKRTGASTFDALYMRCTHAGCLTDIVSNHFECGCHGSAFDVNGTVTNGPASDPLAKLPTVYDPVTDKLTVN